MFLTKAIGLRMLSFLVRYNFFWSNVATLVQVASLLEHEFSPVRA